MECLSIDKPTFLKTMGRSTLGNIYGFLSYVKIGRLIFAFV